MFVFLSGRAGRAALLGYVLSINKRKPYSIALKTTTAKRVLEPTTAAQQEWQ